MAGSVHPFRLTALAPWAWHGIAVPSGTSTLNDIVTDTAMAFAVASALGMMPRNPCLPSVPDYRSHLAALPFKVSLFVGGEENRLNRPLARRLNLDAECGMPKSVDTARNSGNIKDYFHIQEVAAGSIFHGCFLHDDPLSIVRNTYGEDAGRLVVRLGLGRNGVGQIEPSKTPAPICLNLHTARLFDPDVSLKAGPYRLHNIQPSEPLEPDEALRVTAGWTEHRLHS